MESQALSSEPKKHARRRLWSVVTAVCYVIFVLPLWYQSVRVPRAHLPYDEVRQLEDALAAKPLAAVLPSTVTVYVLCQGPGYRCIPDLELSAFAQHLGREVLREVGLQEHEAALVLRVMQDSPGSCLSSAWSPAPTLLASASASSAAAMQCLRLAGSPHLKKVLGMTGRDLDDWAARELRAQGQDRPGSYHVWLLPEPWMDASSPPFAEVGRQRSAAVHYPAVHGPASDEAVRLLARVVAAAFATHIGARPDPHTADLPLPLSATAQLHLSFSLANAHPSRYGNSNGGGGGGFTWSFAGFEAQYLGPVKEVLAPAARVTVSSQVLYFTPPGVNATWDPNLRSHVIPHSQLPLLASSSWPLDPGRTGLPASAAGGPYDGLPYDVAAMPAGLRQISVGEVMLQPVATSGGETAVAAARAAGAPRLLPPQGTESVPPAVLNLVLYAPPAAQRPLALLGADGTRLEHNAYRVDGWGMLQVLNQEPDSSAALTSVGTNQLQDFAVEMVAQLRGLLGLEQPRRRLLNMHAAAQQGAAQQGAAEGDNNASARVSVLSALTTGLAPWEVDALLRRRTARDIRAASAALVSLSRLLVRLPTLAVPPEVGRTVRRAVGVLRRAMEQAAEGRYLDASRSAQEAAGWAEAAFSDPSLSERQNVPETHHMGVYLPFCLPAAVPLVQVLVAEVKRLLRARGAAGRRRGARGEAGKEENVDPPSEPGQAGASGGGGAPSGAAGGSSVAVAGAGAEAAVSAAQ